MAKLHLIRRGAILYLRKRVPRRYRSVESRQFILLSLHTDSEAVANSKAATIWNETLLAWEARLDGNSTDAAVRFSAAKNLAARRGFQFLNAAEVARLPLDEIVARAEAATRPTGHLDPIEAAALLGGATPPKLTVSQALEDYWKRAKANLLGKSEDQIRRWKNPRKKAFKNFIEVVGDIPIEDLTTRDLLKFKDWWVDRIDDGQVGANSANKDLIHLTAVMKVVADANDLELRFSTRKLAIQEGRQNTRPPFSTEWIKSHLLAPGALGGLNAEARAIVLGMINTGYRPSEGAMLTRDQIRLDANIPHIKIEPVGRALKTPHSERVIPLVGVSLEAFRSHPDGFPRYADNPGLSDTVNKYLRTNNLLETDNHSLYSLRHSFEDRMLRAGIDERVRRDLMGHTLNRERYGEGGGLDFLQGELRKIAI